AQPGGRESGGGPPCALIVYGERGTLRAPQPGPTREGGRAGVGRVELITAAGSRFVERPALAADERDGPTHFLSCVSAGRDVTEFCAADVGCDVQETLAAALRSAETGQRVALPID